VRLDNDGRPPGPQPSQTGTTASMRYRLRRLQETVPGGSPTRVQLAALLAGAALIASGQATVAEAGAYVAPFLLISERLAARHGAFQPQCDSGASAAPPRDQGPMGTPARSEAGGSDDGSCSVT
jgi:hypothetical protein